MEGGFFTVTEKISSEHNISVAASGCYHFILIRSGNCQIELAETRKQCGIHELILLKPQTSAVLTQDASPVSLHMYSVKISADMLGDISDEDTDFLRFFTEIPSKISVSTPDNSLLMIVKNLLSELLKQEKQPEFGDRIYRNGLKEIITVLLARAYIPYAQVPSTSNTLVDSILFYISDHITEEITLDNLAAEFNVSERHISRIFKNATQQSVHDYIIQKKLANCMKYIAEGLPIKEVYLLAGFGSYNHFFRAFKKEIQMTPKEYYQKIHQKEQEEENL